MAVTGAARMARRPGVLAWVLWALAMLGLAVVPWLDSLLRQAGRPDLAQLVRAVSLASGLPAKQARQSL
jgi:hypothetical protein